MYGKHFESLYTGSMFGRPAITFAVWGYVLAHHKADKSEGGKHFVELNPLLLAPMFRSTVDEVMQAITELCSPDPRSRTPDQDGRRMVPVSGKIADGPGMYWVVNGHVYKALRDADERREYMRAAQQRHRAKLATSNIVNTVNHGQPRSTQSESESESEPKEEQQTSGTEPPAAPGPSIADQIKDLEQRYPESDRALLRDTRTACALSRKNGKMADGVWLATLQRLAAFPASQVAEACRVFIERHADGSKAESYLLAIARNANGVPRQVLMRQPVQEPPKRRPEL